MSVSQDEHNQANASSNPREKASKEVRESTTRTILSISFQLIPIWIMLLIEFVSNNRFMFKDYIDNILAFDIVTCGTNISEILRKLELRHERKAPSITSLSFPLLFILCLASVMYCLSLVDQLSPGLITHLIVVVIVGIFTFLVVRFNVKVDEDSFRIENNCDGGTKNGK